MAIKIQTRLNTLHLLAAPLIAVTVSNPATRSLLQLLTFGSWNPYLYDFGTAVLVMILYGLYLQVFRIHRKDHWLAILSTTLGVIFVARTGDAFWFLVGFTALFSSMRLLVLELPITLGRLAKDLFAAGIGMVASLVILPVSLMMASGTFVLVQLLYEMLLPERDGLLTRDRFREGFRTAEKILDHMGH